MPSLATLTAFGLVLSSAVNAHFNQNRPATIFFDEDKEPTPECGGGTPDFTKNTVTDFHVGGDIVSTTLLHTQANFIIRGTLDVTAKTGWTQIFPIFQQTGLGDLCQPSVPAPAAWAGKQGLVSVVVDSPDGVLYQCGAVRFVTGKGTGGGNCKNGSSVSVTFTSDPKLSAVVGH